MTQEEIYTMRSQLDIIREKFSSMWTLADGKAEQAVMDQLASLEHGIDILDSELLDALKKLKKERYESS